MRVSRTTRTPPVAACEYQTEAIDLQRYAATATGASLEALPTFLRLAPNGPPFARLHADVSAPAVVRAQVVVPVGSGSQGVWLRAGQDGVHASGWLEPSAWLFPTTPVVFAGVVHVSAARVHVADARSGSVRVEPHGLPAFFEPHVALDLRLPCDGLTLDRPDVQAFHAFSDADFGYVPGWSFAIPVAEQAIPLRAEPDGPVVATLRVPADPYYESFRVLDREGDLIRIAAERWGYVVVGWVPSAMVEPGGFGGGVHLIGGHASYGGTRRECTQGFPLTVVRDGVEWEIGEVAPGGELLVGHHPTMRPAWTVRSLHTRRAAPILEYDAWLTFSDDVVAGLPEDFDQLCPE